MAGTIIADTWQNGDGTQNYKCRAWVNFNGTGTVAIRASGNVSSITDGGVGVYTVNFITAMPDTNFAFTANTGSGAAPTNTVNDPNSFIGEQTVGSAKFYTMSSADVYYDPIFVSVIIHR